ncbi:MAG: hypothetical protein HOO06_08750 [Bdellovibrionaceae bacterium]|jgi:hypothetical protein|nr:hypothetical protein [Pseudobdellovibrionaceae bacterium]
MKLNILLTAIFLVGTAGVAVAESSHSAKLGLVSSYDINGEDVTPEDQTGEEQDSIFKVHYARLNFKGNLNNSLAYRLRFRLNKDGLAVKDDGLDGSVDYAWIEHAVGSGKIRLGKQANEVCAYEQKWGSYRRYHMSAACAAGDRFKYNVGVSYSHKIGAAKLGLGIGNRTNSFDTKETGMATSLWYEGKYFDGLLQPRLTYSTFSHSEQVDAAGDVIADEASGSDTNIGFGLRMESNNILGELEYVSFTDANLTVAGGDDSTTSSINLNLRYTAGAFTPFFKFETSQAATDTDSVYINDASGAGAAAHDAKSGMSLGFEYKPWSDSDFEYFVYHQQDTYSDSTTGSAVVDVKDTVTRLGFRTNISLL